MSNGLFAALPGIFTSVLGEDDLLPYTHGDATVLLKGIFENPTATTPDFEGAGGLVGSTPSLSVATADLPSGAGEGDSVIIDTVTWRVSGPPHHDGRGMTRLPLESMD
jgi:hypothetical protein